MVVVIVVVLLACHNRSPFYVQVSKDGQGLVRVWQQQIEQFRNVSKDMAAAIVANYPSPQLLLTVRCTKSKTKSKIDNDKK